MKDCGSGHCVTCSDEALPLRVVAIEPGALARCVDAGGRSAEVMTDLVGDVERGDVLLVHAGVALSLAERPEDVRR